MESFYTRIARITREQERLLRFERFTARDALALGQFITDRIYEKDMQLAVAVRRINGALLYHHLTEGTSLNNQRWMLRKFNTVSATERCSLAMWAEEGIKGEGPVQHGMDPADYAFCGGGFPIRLKTGELVGVATVSNLPHLEDHAFLVECIADFLGVKDAPQTPTEELF